MHDDDDLPIFQRSSGIWHLDTRRDGKRYRPSLGTRDGQEAKERARAVLAEVAAEPPPRIGYRGLAEAMTTFADTKRHEETCASYKAKAKAICKLLPGDGNILDLSREDVDRYIQLRLDLGISRHTVHKELSLLRQTWAYCCPSQPNPVPVFSARYRPRKRFLTQREAQKLFDAARRSHARVWLWLALYAGAEPAAMRRMTWAHIDFDFGQVHIPGTKTETRDRYVPLHPELRERLETLARDQRLVPRWRNRHRDLKYWCEDAGITHCTLTDIRRTFGSWLKQAGVDSKRVADLMGHTSTIMVDRVYGQLDRAAYEDAISKLPRLPHLVSLGTVKAPS